MEAVIYTVRNISGDYAQLISDDGQELMITLFLLPEDTDIGSRLKHEGLLWESVE